MEGFQSLQQVVAWPMLGAPAPIGFCRQFGQLAMEGEAEPDRRPIALDEGLDFIGPERRSAGLMGFVHRKVGRKQHVAQEFGPRLVIELDQAFEFAQDMGVAEGVIDRVEPTIGQEVVVHDDASVQIFGDRAAFFVSAIKGEGQARSRVQPLQRACDAKSGFVEMANLRLGHARADECVDLPQRLRLLADPGDDAGRTDPWRAEQIAQRLRGAILGEELLDIEIDRRRLDPLALLHRRDHAIRKRRFRLAAATGATVDRRPMFRDQERALGKIEHLPLVDPDRRLRTERRTAMAAGARPMCPITQSGLPTCRNVLPLWPL